METERKQDLRDVALAVVAALAVTVVLIAAILASRDDGVLSKPEPVKGDPITLQNPPAVPAAVESVHRQVLAAVEAPTPGGAGFTAETAAGGVITFRFGEGDTVASRDVTGETPAVPPGGQGRATVSAGGASASGGRGPSVLAAAASLPVAPSVGSGSPVSGAAAPASGTRPGEAASPGTAVVEDASQPVPGPIAAVPGGALRKAADGPGVPDEGQQSTPGAPGGSSSPNAQGTPTDPGTPNDPTAQNGAKGPGDPNAGSDPSGGSGPGGDDGQGSPPKAAGEPIALLDAPSDEGGAPLLRTLAVPAAAVPEPDALVLIGLGLGALALVRRRVRRGRRAS